MDRLESQSINPYTVPGLLPALLGIVMLLLGGCWRSAAGGAARSKRRPRGAFRRHGARRIGLVLALCLVFGVVLVGHGLPFWLASAIFVSVAIVALQQPQRRAAGRGLGLRDGAIAVAIGLGAGGAITLVFQQIFLVRLP